MWLCFSSKRADRSVLDHHKRTKFLLGHLKGAGVGHEGKSHFRGQLGLQLRGAGLTVRGFFLLVCLSSKVVRGIKSEAYRTLYRDGRKTVDGISVMWGDQLLSPCCSYV